MVQSIIYKSKAQPSFNITEVKEMLQGAKVFNREHNITGIIVYYDTYFIQLIEGNKEIIESLYKNIKSDKRHYNVDTILCKESKKSLWNTWSMAFYDLSVESEQTNYLKVLLESSFENVSKTQKNSEVLNTLRQQVFNLLKN